MITLTKIRDLDLDAPSSPGRSLHLSAASGLIRTDRSLYVVADDELHLGVFPSSGSEPGHLIRLFPGELPDSAKQRKARKPDTETLMRLPPFAGYVHGALLVLGSGSKRQRCGGALVAFDAQGVASGDPREIDLTALYAVLDDQVGGLNIEGGAVNGDDVCLLQRGNKRGSQNALVRFQLAALSDWLDSKHPATDSPSLAVIPVDLGTIDDIPLCFTDGAALPNGDMVFSAVAEATEDSYFDGPCHGAAIGVVDKHGHLRCLHHLAHPYKIEGIDATVEGDHIRLLMVTDADDATIPAGLYSAVLPRESVVESA